MDPLPHLAVALDTGSFWNVRKSLSLGQNVSSQRGDKYQGGHHDSKAVSFTAWAVMFSDGLLISSFGRN